MAFNFKKFFQNPEVMSVFKKAVTQAAGEGVTRARSERPAREPNLASGVRKAIEKARGMGNKKTVAESTVESATKMKKGGMADKSGRAMKRRTADTKGRAMRKGK